MVATHSHLQFVIATGDERSASVIKEIDAKGTRVVVGETYDLLNAADVAAVTSGTATLETAMRFSLSTTR